MDLFPWLVDIFLKNRSYFNISFYPIDLFVKFFFILQTSYNFKAIITAFHSVWGMLNFSLSYAPTPSGVKSGISKENWAINKVLGGHA